MRYDLVNVKVKIEKDKVIEQDWEFNVFFDNGDDPETVTADVLAKIDTILINASVAS